MTIRWRTLPRRSRSWWPSDLNAAHDEGFMSHSASRTGSLREPIDLRRVNSTQPEPAGGRPIVTESAPAASGGSVPCSTPPWSGPDVVRAAPVPSASSGRIGPAVGSVTSPASSSWAVSRWGGSPPPVTRHGLDEGAGGNRFDEPVHPTGHGRIEAAAHDSAGCVIASR